MAPVLGYWNIRGLAQPIRLMLAYTETPFVDKQYAYGPAPDYDRSAWLKEKDMLGLDFPNLPYYIEDNVKLTQSVTIMRYLARKHKLDPEGDDNKRRADQIEQQIVDIRGAFAKLCYNPEFEKLKDEYVEAMPEMLKQLSMYLSKDDWYASKDKPTYVDFMVYETLDHHRQLDPEPIKDYPSLTEFLFRFERLPTIKKYMESDDFMKSPLNGDIAYFGSRRTMK